MFLPFVDEYRKKSVTMPDREDRKLDKDSEQYNLQVAQYVYKTFIKGNTYIPWDYYSVVRTNRLYANGQQDSSIYEDAFYGKENQDNTLEGWRNLNSSRKARKKAIANLNFTIQSPAPKVMDSIVNKLMELVHRVSVDATDEYSGMKREEMKYGSYVDGKFKKEFEILRTLMGLPQQEEGYTPRSVEELNLYEAEGGFKLTYEETMESLLKYVFEQSNWEEYTVEQVLRDLITVGYAAVIDEYDKSSGQVKAKYLDAEYVGVQYTKDSGNYDPDYGFFVKKVKLSEIKKQGIAPEKIIAVAKTYANQFGNPEYEDNNKSNKTINNASYGALDDWTVPVFVVYWKDVDHRIEREYKNRQGKSRTKSVDAKYKFKKGDKEIYTRVKTVRQVHWVIASEIVYDYGKSEFQARDGKKEPVLPIHLVQTSSKPFVARIIPSLDQFMQGWMKLQHGLSMSVMDGYAIDMDAISNLSMDGKDLRPIEVLRFWRQTGTLFFKMTDVAGRPNGVPNRPIEKLQGGAGAVILEAMQVMDVAIKQIEELTGVNAVSMGAQPNPEQGKAVTEYAIMGTNDILKGILKKANVLKSDVARALCLRLQHVIEADKRAYNAYKWIGETKLKAITIANGHDVTYGIRTHARPTEEEILSMRDMLANALKNGRDGKARITEGDYFRFLGMLNSGASLKRIALLLDFALDKAQKREDEKASRAQKESVQGAQMLEAQKAQQKQAEMQADTQGNLLEEKAKGLNALLEKAVETGELTALQAMTYLGIGNMQPPAQAPQPEAQVNTPEEAQIPAGQEGV